MQKNKRASFLLGEIPARRHLPSHLREGGRHRGRTAQGWSQKAGGGIQRAKRCVWYPDPDADPQPAPTLPLPLSLVSILEAAVDQFRSPELSLKGKRAAEAFPPRLRHCLGPVVMIHPFQLLRLAFTPKPNPKPMPSLSLSLSLSLKPEAEA